MKPIINFVVKYDIDSSSDGYFGNSVLVESTYIRRCKRTIT